MTKEIKNWLAEKPRKLILCESMKNGGAWVRGLNRFEGVDVSGVTVTNLQMLAKEIIIAKQSYEKESAYVDCIDDDTAKMLIKNIISGKEYESIIPRETVDTALAGEFYRIINELRCGKKNPNFQPNEADKINISLIEKVQKDYAKMLKNEEDFNEGNCYDNVALILTAIRILENTQPGDPAFIRFKKQNVGLLLPWDLLPLEKRFIEAFLPFTAEDYLTEISMIHRDINELRCGDIRVVKAYTMANEIRNIVKNIREKKIPISDVDILCMDQKLLSSGLMIMAEEGIPVYVDSGVEAVKNPMLQFVLEYCDWISEGGVRDLEYQIGKAGFVVYDKGLAETQGRKVASEDYDTKVLETTEQLRMIFQTDGEDLLKNWFDRIDTAVRLHAKERGLTWAGYVAIMGLLRKRYSYDNSVMDVKAAAEEISSAVKKMRINKETNGSAVRMMLFSKRYVTDRDYIYFVGMSDSNFSISTADSSLLKRAVINQMVELPDIYALTPQEQKEKFLNDTLCMTKAKQVTMSYAGYDVTQTIPQELAVSIYMTRLMKELGKTNPDESESGYKILDYNYIDGKNDDWILDEVEQNQENPTLSKKTGPEKLSASNLNQMLECPRRYYYNKVRSIYVKEELKLDTGSWLDAARKGTLCHNTFQEYCNAELVGKTDVSEVVNESKLNEIFDDLVERLKKEVPIPSQVVFDREVNEYRKGIFTTLQNLHRELHDKPDNKQWQVFACELQIGMNDGDLLYTEKIAVEKDENSNPTISLDVCFYGELDRVDQYKDETGKHHFRIIDYKTGNFEKQEEKIKNNKWPQHVVYKKILEDYLKNTLRLTNFTIDEFIYVFPFEKKNKYIRISGESLTKFGDDIEETLVKVLYKHEYNSGETNTRESITKRNYKGRCDYCNYASMCIDLMGNKL